MMLSLKRNMIELFLPPPQSRQMRREVERFCAEPAASSLHREVPAAARGGSTGGRASTPHDPPKLVFLPNFAPRVQIQSCVFKTEIAPGVGVEQNLDPPLVAMGAERT